MLNITITEQTPANMLRAIRAACNELLGDMPAELTGAGIPVPSEERASALLAEQSFLASAFDKTVEAVGAPAVAQALIDPPAPYAQGGPVNAGQFYRVGEQPSEQTVLGTAQADAPETDSSGAEWNPELHASTKTKNADGTWKKRRGSGQAATGTDSKQEVEEMLAEQYSQTPALPPLPPAPPATSLVTMNDIYALISGGKCVLNDVIAAAQAMGFADVGAFSRDATPEQRAQLLQELTA